MSGAHSMVSWLCPSCDVDPPPGLTEPVCPSCGARLIEVRSRSEDLTGTVIDGRFEIRDLLGEGGMGSVYRAWQRSIGREVAVKLIDKRHSRDSMAVRRFLREARLASQLSQPNTVSVFDFGQSADGRLFIAMELIRGKTLAEALEREGPFSVSRAAWIGVQLCDALDAAHRLQIVHRDLKPANIVVLDDPPGRDLIKVLDFGLAKSLTESETQATDTGLVVGTPRYMAPEVVMGEKPTPASDLYAVGVILGELTTGKVMWDATSFPSLAGQKLQGSPIIHEVPSAIRNVVARLIDPSLSRRPSSASEVRGLLRPLVMNAETPVPFTGQVKAIVTPGKPLKVTAPTVAMRGEDPTMAAPTPLPELATPSPRPAAPRSSTSASVAAVKPPMRWPRVLAGLAVAGALLVTIVVVSRGGARSTPTSGTATGSTGGTGGGTAPAAALDATAATPPELDAAPAIDPIDPIDAAPPSRTDIVLHVTSRPDGAEISVDGVARGPAPVDVRIPAGTPTVTIEATRNGRRIRKLVSPDRDQTVELVLPRGGVGPGTGVPF